MIPRTPNDVAELLREAQALMDQQRYPQAVALMEGHAQTPSGRFQRTYAEALCHDGRAPDAVGALMKALELKPDDVDAYLQLAFTFQTLQMPDEAAECYRTVAVLKPDSLMAQAYLSHGDQRGVRWAEFDANLADFLRVLRAKPADAADEFGVPFALLGVPHEPADMLKLASISTRFLTKGLHALPPLRAQARPRLTIGYLSADFHAHATVALLVEALESRDRERFEVLLFSHGPDDGSPQRQRIMQACDRFIDVTNETIAGLAARIRQEGVDILVDLKGHTAGSRWAALAHRPAPVQVAWLGFPGTCGADFVDYIIGDPVVTPLDDGLHFSECIAQMPLCYQPTDGQRQRLEPPPRAELGLPEDARVLLSANQVYKITPSLFDAWMEILRRLPQAVLWQLSGGEQADARLRQEALRRDVDPQRILFAPQTDMATHWRRLGAADLALDTWPCTGHTTTRDCLAAGVPVLTIKGDGFASRVAASILEAGGMGEFVAADVDSYVQKACDFMRELPRVTPGRASEYTSAHFARDLEALYERMWQRAVAGLPPAALPAIPS